VAKDACSGMEVDGRRIRVDYSITQRAHTPTPGVYMGRPSRSGHLGHSRSPRADRRRERERTMSPTDNYRSRNSYRDDRYERSYRRSSSRQRYRNKSYSRSRSPKPRKRYFVLSFSKICNMYFPTRSHPFALLVRPGGDSLTRASNQPIGLCQTACGEAYD